MQEDTISRIEASLDKPIEDLEPELPGLLDEIDGRTRELVETDPVVFVQVVDRLKDVDVGEFAAENPETAAQFQDLLWSGVEIFVEYNPETVENIPEETVVDFTATDAPLAGHLRIHPRDHRLTGETGTTDEADISLSGPADTLVGIITGEVDPVQGFMAGEFELDGDVGRAAQLGELFGTIADEGYESLAETVEKE